MVTIIVATIVLVLMTISMNTDILSALGIGWSQYSNHYHSSFSLLLVIMRVMLIIANSCCSFLRPATHPIRMSAACRKPSPGPADPSLGRTWQSNWATVWFRV